MEDPQQHLPMPAQREHIPDSIIHTCPDIISAVRLMITSAGYSFDQVGTALGFSPSHWSEILNGKKNLPWPKLDAAMDFCESDLPLVWWNDRRGYEKPRPKQDMKDRRICELEMELAQEKMEKEVIKKWMKEMKG